MLIQNINSQKRKNIYKRIKNQEEKENKMAVVFFDIDGTLYYVELAPDSLSKIIL